MSNARQLAQQAVLPAPFRNRLINGDMRINQRGYSPSAYTSIIATAAGSTYTLDRWAVAVGFSDLIEVFGNAATAGILPGFGYYTRIKCKSVVSAPAVDTYIGFRQVIEGLNLQDFAFGTPQAKPITLSFFTRSLTPGTYPVSFRRADTSRSYTTTFTISAADVWEKKIITIPADTAGPTSNYGTGGVLQVWFDLGSGANFNTTPNVWGADGFVPPGVTRVAAALANFLDFTGLQLEAGSVATNFEQRSVAFETALCQRYYEITDFVLSNALTYATSSFRVLKRVAPSLTLSGQGGTSGTITAQGQAWFQNTANSVISGANVAGNAEL